MSTAMQELEEPTLTDSLTLDANTGDYNTSPLSVQTKRTNLLLQSLQDIQDHENQIIEEIEHRIEHINEDVSTRQLYLAKINDDSDEEFKEISDDKSSQSVDGQEDEQTEHIIDDETHQSNHGHEHQSLDETDNEQGTQDESQVATPHYRTTDDDISLSPDQINSQDGDEDTKETEYDDGPSIEEQCLNSTLKFGSNFEEIECIRHRYPYPIPRGLFGCNHLLEKKNAFEIEGIFRLRGNESAINNAKAKLVSDEWTIQDLDANCSVIELCQILKAFFRELPISTPGMLNTGLMDSKTNEDLISNFRELTEPRRSLLLWLFDLWIEVESETSVNKMTILSMSIVFSPNLVRTDDDTNPMIFLQYQKNAQDVLLRCANLYKEGRLINMDELEVVEEPLYVAPIDTSPNVPVTNVRTIETRGRVGDILANCVFM